MCSDPLQRRDSFLCMSLNHLILSCAVVWTFFMSQATMVVHFNARAPSHLRDYILRDYLKKKTFCRVPIRKKKHFAEFQSPTFITAWASVLLLNSFFFFLRWCCYSRSRVQCKWFPGRRPSKAAAETQRGENSRRPSKTEHD
jgi:hypothetical protein